jgi:serine protease Do
MSMHRHIRPHGLFFLAFCTLGAPMLLVTGSGCSNEAQASPPTQPNEVAETPDQTGQSTQSAASSAPGATAKPSSLQYNPHDSLAPLVAEVEDSVVSIQARKSRTGLFGGGGGGGIGSGFIISQDGLVVTNHHVAAGNNEFEVHLHDGRRFAATVVGSDPQTDVAVLRLTDAKGLPVVEFGSSEELRVGDWVVAMGSPMGLEHTVTRGIISAKGRGSLGLYEDGYADFLQTDAAINPGNSGGPLFNLDGEVVGINTAIGGHDGLGFAIPADQAKIVVPKLIRDGKVTRGWLGISGRDEPPPFGVMPEKGAIIGEIHAGTPAATAGLRAGDRVVKIDGRDIASFEQLRTRIAEQEPNQKIALELIRDGKLVSLDVELGERPNADTLASIPAGRGVAPAPAPAPQQPKATADLYSGQPARLGVEVREQPEGVVVERVVDGGIGHRLGLRQGDVIQRVNGKSVGSVVEIFTALEADRSHAQVEVTRGNKKHTAEITAG